MVFVVDGFSQVSEGVHCGAVPVVRIEGACFEGAYGVGALPSFASIGAAWADHE